MNLSSECDTQELLINTVHDIRQPLGNIESSAYLLGLWLRDGPEHVREQIRLIERQVDLASRILLEASAQVNRRD